MPVSEAPKVPETASALWKLEEYLRALRVELRAAEARHAAVQGFEQYLARGKADFSIDDIKAEIERVEAEVAKHRPTKVEKTVAAPAPETTSARKRVQDDG